MMRKALFQGLITVLLFLSGWFALSQVKWVQVFRVDERSRNLEQKLGDTFFDLFRNTQEEIDSVFINNAIDSLLTRICSDNVIDRSDLKVHVLLSDEVNAFALPDRHIILNSGLIIECENPEVLCGVISHELAHIESGHVMKKLIREVGLSMLVSITTSSAGTEAISNAATVLSSRAYDRNLETEADRLAAEYLIKAGIDVVPFASFLSELPEKGDNDYGLSWISTHPDAEERARKILEYSQGQKPGGGNLISRSAWTRLKGELESL